MAQFPSPSHVQQILLTASTLDEPVLDVSGCNLNGDSAAFVLADTILANRFFSFVQMNFDRTAVSPRAFDSIVSAASENRNLIVFSARDNNLPSEAGFAISRLLLSSGNLSALDLASNALGDEGVAAIAGAFASNFVDVPSSTTARFSIFSLRVIDLSSNSVTDMGVLALCKGLQQIVRDSRLVGRSVSLRALRLDANKIGDKGALSLSQILALQDDDSFALQELSLNDNFISSQGLRAILTGSSSRPLVLLRMSRNLCDLHVLDKLAALCACGQAPQALELHFDERSSSALLDEASSYHQSAGRTHGRRGVLTGVMTQLVEALLVTCAHQVGLGALPEALCLALIAANEGQDAAKFHDLRHSLIALNRARELLGLPHEISNWVDQHLGAHQGSEQPVPVSTLLQRGEGSKSSSSIINTTAASMSEHSTGRSSISPLAVTPQIELRHEEFARIRTEHSTAFQVLAEEIQKLVSPTHISSVNCSNTAHDMSIDRSTAGRAQEAGHALLFDDSAGSPFSILDVGAVSSRSIPLPTRNPPSPARVLQTHLAKDTLFGALSPAPDTSSIIDSTSKKVSNMPLSMSSAISPIGYSRQQATPLQQGNGIRALLDEAVASAVITAQRDIWASLGGLIGSPENNNNNDSNNNRQGNLSDFAAFSAIDKEERVDIKHQTDSTSEHLRARIDFLQVRLVALEAQAILQAEMASADKARMASLEDRLSSLEHAVSGSSSSGHSPSLKVSKDLALLASRLDGLETIVEREHEVGVKLLDKLLASRVSNHSAAASSSINESSNFDSSMRSPSPRRPLAQSRLLTHTLSSAPKGWSSQKSGKLLQGRLLY